MSQPPTGQPPSGPDRGWPPPAPSWPPGPHGAAGWGPPPGPDPSSRSERRVLFALVGVAAVLVLAALVTLAVAFAPVDPPAAAVAPTAVPTRALPAPGTGGLPPPSVSAGPPAPADPAGFLDRLPADFTDCTPDEPAGDGDLAAARCGPATTQPGPSEAGFYLYPDVATLEEVFRSDVGGGELTEWADDADCSTADGYGSWRGGLGAGGQVACAVTSDGYVVVAWTDSEHVTEGVVRAPGTTQADAGALYEWWTTHGSFRE